LERIGVGRGNQRDIQKGTWTIIHGTKTHPDAILYQLDQNAPEDLRTYWAVDPNILLILDTEMNPRIGDANESYALNRINAP
jgi:hypothetical protein